MKRVVLLMFAAMCICAVAADNLSQGKRYFESGQYRTALPYLQSAAKEGYGEACYLLGRMYCKGLGTEKNYEVARRMFERGLEYGCPYGEAQLGEMYENGLGVQKDMAKAVGYYRKSAGRGLADGQYMMAMCYWDGKGVKQRRDSTFSLLRKVMNNDGQFTYSYMRGRYILGECYEYGYGTEVNIEKAIECYYERWGYNGRVSDPEYIYRAAVLARYNGLDYWDDYIKLAIEHGCSSPEILYKRYQWLCGEDVTEWDCFSYLEKAVEAGYGPALREMAEHYEEGSGVPVNYAKAKEYAARADKWFATHAEYEEQQRAETDAAFRNSRGMYHVGDTLKRNDTLYLVEAVSSRFEPVKLYNLTDEAERIAGYLRRYSNAYTKLSDFALSYAKYGVWLDKNNKPYVVQKRDDKGNPIVLAVPEYFSMSYETYMNGGNRNVLSTDEARWTSRKYGDMKYILEENGKERLDFSEAFLTSEHEGDKVTTANLNNEEDSFTIQKGKKYRVMVKCTIEDLRRNGLAD